MQDSRKNAAREHKVIFEGLEQAEGTEEDAVEMMSRIENYLDSSYFLAINPLPQLRKILPQYDWQFVRPESLQQARDIVSKADFVWRTDWFNGRWLDSSSTEVELEECFPVEFATASLRDRPEPLRHFFAGEKGESEETTSKLEFVKGCGGEAAYFNITNR